jgi:hypothetical protein
MKLIEPMLEELKEISKDWNSEVITKDELNLKLDLLLLRIEFIEIDYSKSPLTRLDARIQDSFNQLLFRTKYKAKHCINLLKDTSNKKGYNARLRLIINNKLYFNPLYKTIKNSISGYIDRNKLRHTREFQIFINRREA